LRSAFLHFCSFVDARTTFFPLLLLRTYGTYKSVRTKGDPGKDGTEAKQTEKDGERTDRN
jgi:hypothetical protein